MEDVAKESTCSHVDELCHHGEDFHTEGLLFDRERPEFTEKKDSLLPLRCNKRLGKPSVSFGGGLLSPIPLAAGEEGSLKENVTNLLWPGATPQKTAEIQSPPPERILTAFRDSEFEEKVAPSNLLEVPPNTLNESEAKRFIGSGDEGLRPSAESQHESPLADKTHASPTSASNSEFPLSDNTLSPPKNNTNQATGLAASDLSSAPRDNEAKKETLKNPQEIDVETSSPSTSPFRTRCSLASNEVDYRSALERSPDVPTKSPETAVLASVTYPLTDEGKPEPNENAYIQFVESNVAEPTREGLFRQQSAVNDSVTSTGSLREEELERTQQELGANSLAFIERLRGAAIRRKMNLARSRDSLATKEREHRKAIAEAALHRQSDPVAQASTKTNRRQSLPAMPTAVKSFRARPLPKSTGSKGIGGMSGVPKVEKKMATAPISPMLGPRRQKGKIPTSPELAMSDEEEGMSLQFKARPLPKTTSELGHAGQSGIPKVAKRPVTVPESPLLGARRPTQPEQRIPEAEPSSLDIPSTRRSVGCSSSTRSSQALLGLQVFSIEKENETATNTMEYIPHSTRRAQKRAEFEIQRAENEERRKEQERRERQGLVRRLRRELDVLREEL